MTNTKTCNKCKKELAIDNFKKRKVSKDGLAGWCKECDKQYNKQYQQDNKVDTTKQKKQYRQKHKEEIKQHLQDNKETIAKRTKQYRQDNQETIVEYKRQYQQEHKEQIKQYQRDNKESLSEYKKQYQQDNKVAIVEKRKQYIQEHLEELRVYTQKRRARKRLLLSTLTKEQWEGIKEHFNNECAYCGETKKLTIEHFIPVSKLGELSVGNILPICSRCNSSKNDSNFFTWFGKQSYYSKERENKILKYLGYKNEIQQLQLIV